MALGPRYPGVEKTADGSRGAELLFFSISISNTFGTTTSIIYVQAFCRDTADTAEHNAGDTRAGVDETRQSRCMVVIPAAAFSASPYVRAGVLLCLSLSVTETRTPVAITAVQELIDYPNTQQQQQSHADEYFPHPNWTLRRKEMSPRHRLWPPRVWRYALVDVFNNASLRRCKGRKASTLKYLFIQNRADNTAIVGFDRKKKTVHFRYDFLPE